MNFGQANDEHRRDAQPRVVNNDWKGLRPPALDEWTPTRSVSVIVPAFQPAHLRYVLAGLAAQSYPSHLLQVVVVDDGSEPPITLPELRPENTSLVRTHDGWGRAAACHAGVQRSDGDVLHWLDSDMVPCREEVEAHARWHHVIDYAVVLGNRQFTSADGLVHLKPAALRDAVASRRHPRDLTAGTVRESGWTEAIMRETNELSAAGFRAMRLHVGASGSVRRDLYEECGGMPLGLVLGEDIVLGYRLREVGGVFIPDRSASSLHLGTSGVGQRQEDTNRYNKPFLTDLVPELRGHRLRVPRLYAVPYVEVVIPAEGSNYETVSAAINAQLAGSVPDVQITVIAPWNGLDRGRLRPLDDAARDFRMLHAAFCSDPRVHFRECAAERSAATFRLSLPAADLYPVGGSLEGLLRRMEDEHLGMATVDLPTGARARVVRTASLSRARRLMPVHVDGDPHDIMDQVTLTSRISAEEAGFVTPLEAPKIKHVRGLVSWGVGAVRT